MPQHLGADDRLEPPRGAQRVSHHRLGGADVHLVKHRERKTRKKKRKNTHTQNEQNKGTEKGEYIRSDTSVKKEYTYVRTNNNKRERNNGDVHMYDII